MRYTWTACLLTLFCSLAHSATHDHLFFTSQCAIYSEDGELERRYPGGQCRFLADGRFIAGGENELVLYGADLNPIWKKQMHVHHLLNMTSDGRLLVTSSDV